MNLLIKLLSVLPLAIRAVNLSPFICMSADTLNVELVATEWVIASVGLLTTLTEF